MMRGWTSRWSCWLKIGKNGSKQQNGLNEGAEAANGQWWRF